MKTRLIPSLTAALAAGTTFTAFADLPQLDSAKFAYKYEMVLRVMARQNKSASVDLSSHIWFLCVRRILGAGSFFQAKTIFRDDRNPQPDPWVQKGFLWNELGV